MNDLYLIGNGFDLAHGLKTSYSDFLLWYLNMALNSYNASMSFKDPLISISHNGERRQIKLEDSICDLLEWCKESNYFIRYNSTLFEKILSSSKTFRWVDIEYEYYMDLVRLYKEIELHPQSKDSVVIRVKGVNSCFEFIKKKLVEYLLTIEITSKQENRKIQGILLEGTGSEGKEQGEKLFVNFNYTKTLEFYTSKNFPTNNNLINIHGELSYPSNPIIFGYGDEMDPHYEKIENLNNNEFLKNIKSFGYFKTTNYQDTIRFVESGDFTVKILGHSCGLSDRILLNTIFEHPNCKAIKIYYYQKSQSENDYFEKTQEISRHFKASGKGDMRTKIVPFSQSVPLIPFVSNN